ncbi:hypothetical protein SO802_001347 [Lithocarpus litseifolius]|uniref:Protein kinase domain-containing protein n=1 Tax=Lithocarpus litseifolius TaxID=425828 RepID=A0AAW2DXL6_9ROSI
MQANQTGQIYINSSEQINCLDSMKSVQGDIFGCGIEKLTRGAGGCSDFSVEDVTSRMGDDLRRLNENCELVNSDGEFEQSCSSCGRTWENISGSDSTSTYADSKNEADICRFAVLVSLTASGLEDENHVLALYRCLGAQKITETQALEGKSKKNISSGKVYKGILSNNQHVAIKHIIDDGNIQSFVREVTSLSHVRHPNLVTLMGCCLMEDECFLVYEFCPNGNLSEWLFGKDKVLTWIQRLEVAIGSARGLWFLHTYPEGCIVHRDIKPTNILLGANFEAKLSDLGLSKVIDMGESNVSLEVRGTFGYVDLEYQSNHRVNSSADVYGFGIVLLQIVSGKKVINLNLKKPRPLSKMFSDPKLDGEYSTEAFDLTLQLALSCTSLKKERPSMEQVVERLKEALEISTRAKAGAPQIRQNSLSRHKIEIPDKIS